MQRPQRAGAGDAERDGQGNERPERVPSGVHGWTSRRCLRVTADDQRVPVQGCDEYNVTL